MPLSNTARSLSGVTSCILRTKRCINCRLRWREHTVTWRCLIFYRVNLKHTVRIEWFINTTILRNVTPYSLAEGAEISEDTRSRITNKCVDILGFYWCNLDFPQHVSANNCHHQGDRSALEATQAWSVLWMCMVYDSSIVVICREMQPSVYLSRQLNTLDES
jgi:hypothetical protein